MTNAILIFAISTDGTNWKPSLLQLPNSTITTNLTLHVPVTSREVPTAKTDTFPVIVSLVVFSLVFYLLGAGLFPWLYRRFPTPRT